VNSRPSPHLECLGLDVIQIFLLDQFEHSVIIGYLYYVLRRRRGEYLCNLDETKQNFSDYREPSQNARTTCESGPCMFSEKSLG
jgi:hypothetical protein